MLVESNTLLITVKKFLPKSIGSVPKIGGKGSLWDKRGRDRQL